MRGNGMAVLPSQPERCFVSDGLIAEKDTRARTSPHPGWARASRPVAGLREQVLFSHTKPLASVLLSQFLSFRFLALFATVRFCQKTQQFLCEQFRLFFRHKMPALGYSYLAHIL